MSKGHILVVDDSHASARYLEVLLCADGYDVHIASDARTALAIADEHVLLLALLDLQLPDMHGCELAMRLKAHPSTRGIPLIAVSASDWVSDMDRARDAGIASFMTKPVGTLALRKAIAKFVKAEPPA